VSRFATTLSQTSRRLNLPQHIKTRVVLELAADLEDLFEHYSAQGLSEEDATARALEATALSDEAIARLVEVHTSPTGRLVERLAERTRTPWERLMLLLIALFVVIGIGREMPYTLEEIGRVMSLSRERVRQIEATALKKIQQAEEQGTLREFLA